MSIMRQLWSDPAFLAAIGKKRMVPAGASSAANESNPPTSNVQRQTDLTKRLGALIGPYKEAVSQNGPAAAQMQGLMAAAKQLITQRNVDQASKILDDLEQLVGQSETMAPVSAAPAASPAAQDFRHEPGFGKGADAGGGAVSNLPESKPATAPQRAGHQPGFGKDPHAIDVQKKVNEASYRSYWSAQEADKHLAELDKKMAGEKEVRGFIAKYYKTYEAEIASNPNAGVKALGREIETQRELLSLSSKFVELLKTYLLDAQRKLRSAQKHLQSVKDLDEAHELAEKAEQWNKQGEDVLSICGAVLEIAVMVTEGHYIHTFKAVWELYSKAVTLAAENPYTKAAKDMRVQGTDEEIRATEIAILAASEAIDSVDKLFKEQKTDLRDVVQHFIDLQKASEEQFDKSTKRGFKFGTLSKHFDWVEDGLDLVNFTKEYVDTAVEDANDFKDWASDLKDAKINKEAQEVVDRMGKGMAAVLSAYQSLNELKPVLSKMLEKGHLITAPRPKSGP
jgi:hypothetical protein